MADLPDVVPQRSPAPEPLFREEALAERRGEWLGTVVVAPRPSHGLFVAFAALAAGAVLALLFFGEYTRKARINGWLVPQEGLVRVFAPRPGVVTALRVDEGRAVRKGEPLLTLSEEVQSAAFGSTQAEVSRRLAERKKSLAHEREQQQLLLGQQEAALQRRLEGMRAEEEQLGREIDVLRSRVRIAESAEGLHRKLLKQGFISDQRMASAAAETLEQRARLAALERSRIALARQRGDLEAEAKDLPLKGGREIGQVERTIAQLEQERAETEAKREIVIPAPQDGTVTSIQAVPGGHAAAAVPLLAIVPADARLEAHLYAPSRAMGFVRPGQRVLIRYQAYPYQKFGHQEGVVASLSRAAVSAAELPAPLAGASLGGGAASEPVYRITVRLDKPFNANGEAARLQPGMLLEADIALEKRRLYEWVLDPFHSVARTAS